MRMADLIESKYKWWTPEFENNYKWVINCTMDEIKEHSLQLLDNCNDKYDCLADLAELCFAIRKWLRVKNFLNELGGNECIERYEYFYQFFFHIGHYAFNRLNEYNYKLFCKKVPDWASLVEEPPKPIPNFSCDIPAYRHRWQRFQGEM